MERKDINIPVEFYATTSELSELECSLVEKAKEATQNAYAPYSQFLVGAAVLLDNGEIILGNNQENIAYPSGLCAERTALFYAGAKYPNTAVKAIAIAAQTQGKFVTNPIPPCGACRQVMAECELRAKSPIRVLMASQEQVIAVHSVASLLPLSFDLSSMQS
ncbi:MAG: cytidine deaminase [Bacteroidales bacterium]